MEGSTEQLVALAIRGDRGAFGQLITRCERAMLAIAYAIIGEASAAADATQEAFLRAWQRLTELDDSRRFEAWLARIVRNAAHDQRRGKSKREVESDVEQADHRPFASPTSGLESHERETAIATAMKQLDELTRAAVALRYYEQLGSRQIAELLDLTPAAVDMRLSRGRTQLKQALSELQSGV